MSMNLELHGKQVGENGKLIYLSQYVYNIWQTPTDVTYDILEKPTFELQCSAYLVWMKSVVQNDKDFEHYKGKFNKLIEYHESQGWRLFFTCG